MTTLRLPRYTKPPAPSSVTLARAISRDLGLPVSWDVDTRRQEMVVDLREVDEAAANEAAIRYIDASGHDVAWRVIA